VVLLELLLVLHLLGLHLLLVLLHLLLLVVHLLAVLELLLLVLELLLAGRRTDGQTEGRTEGVAEQWRWCHRVATARGCPPRPRPLWRGMSSGRCSMSSTQTDRES
jgi:hypothetical protein